MFYIQEYIEAFSAIETNKLKIHKTWNKIVIYLIFICQGGKVSVNIDTLLLNQNVNSIHPWSTFGTALKRMLK